MNDKQLDQEWEEEKRDWRARGCLPNHFTEWVNGINQDADEWWASERISEGTLEEAMEFIREETQKDFPDEDVANFAEYLADLESSLSEYWEEG